MLGACSSLEPACATTLTSEELKRIETTTTWTASGRLSARYNTTYLHGSFVWRQQADNFDVTVIGPLGVGMLHIHGDVQTAVVEDQDNTIALDDFIQQYMHAPVDINILKKALLGLPQASIFSITHRYTCTTKLLVPEKTIITLDPEKQITLYVKSFF